MSHTHVQRSFIYTQTKDKIWFIGSNKMISVGDLALKL